MAMAAPVCFVLFLFCFVLFCFVLFVCFVCFGPTSLVGTKIFFVFVFDFPFNPSLEPPVILLYVDPLVRLRRGR